MIRNKRGKQSTIKNREGIGEERRFHSNCETFGKLGGEPNEGEEESGENSGGGNSTVKEKAIDQSGQGKNSNEKEDFRFSLSPLVMGLQKKGKRDIEGNGNHWHSWGGGRKRACAQTYPNRI